MAAITKQDVLKKIDAILKFIAPEAIVKYAKDGNYRYYLATGVRVNAFNEGDPELPEISLQRLMWQIPGGMKYNGVFEKEPAAPEAGKEEQGTKEPQPDVDHGHQEPEPPVTVPEEATPETKVEETPEEQVKSKASVVK